MEERWLPPKVVRGKGAPPKLVSSRALSAKEYSKSKPAPGPTIEDLACSILRGSIDGLSESEAEHLGVQVLAPFVRSQVGTGTLDWDAAEAVALEIRRHLEPGPGVDI